MSWARKCKWCGGDFTANNGNKKFCSDSCLKKSGNELARIKFATDPEYRDYMNAKSLKRHNERWASDPEYRRRRKERSRQWKRNKLENDPVYRDRCREAHASWHQTKRCSDSEWLKRRKEKQRVHREKIADLVAVLRKERPDLLKEFEL
jgi:hypothetical protein